MVAWRYETRYLMHEISKQTMYYFVFFITNNKVFDKFPKVANHPKISEDFQNVAR